MRASQQKHASSVTYNAAVYLANQNTHEARTYDAYSIRREAGCASPPLVRRLSTCQVQVRSSLSLAKMENVVALRAVIGRFTPNSSDYGNGVDVHEVKYLQSKKRKRKEKSSVAIYWHRMTEKVELDCKDSKSPIMTFGASLYAKVRSSQSPVDRSCPINIYRITPPGIRATFRISNGTLGIFR